MPSSAENPSPIAARLRELAESRAGQAEVAEVRIGLTYTGVRLADGACGVALTFLDGWERSCRPFGERPPLGGQPARALLAGLASPEPVEAALGLACANALFNRPGAGGAGGDVLGAVEIRPTDRVVMVGHFQPLVGRLRQRAARLDIFERKPSAAPDVRPADEVFSALPRADVALITSTAILNHSLDPILAAARGCRQVVLLGASTPLCPEAFAGGPVSLLSGVVVREAEAVLQTISEGGGMFVFKRFVDKVNLPAGAP